MDANYQHILVVGPVENRHLSLGRQMGVHAPQKVVVEFLRLRPLEPDDAASRGIHAAEDMPDHAILAARVQPLNHNQERVLLLRVHQVLQLIQSLYESPRHRQGRVTRLVTSQVARIDLAQLHFTSRPYDELLVKVRHLQLFPTQYARLDLWQGRLMQVETAIVRVDAA